MLYLTARYSVEKEICSVPSVDLQLKFVLYIILLLMVNYRLLLV